MPRPAVKDCKAAVCPGDSSRSCASAHTASKRLQAKQMAEEMSPMAIPLWHARCLELTHAHLSHKRILIWQTATARTYDIMISCINSWSICYRYLVHDVNSDKTFSRCSSRSARAQLQALLSHHLRTWSCWPWSAHAAPIPDLSLLIKEPFAHMFPYIHRV